jgi:hypothetical protein
MSLNRTLDRLFDEIRREAKRNPDFADRLDAVLRLHESRRDVAEEIVEEMAGNCSAAREEGEASPASAQSPESAPSLNPVGLFKREGEEALSAALSVQDLAQLQALVAEHNLDPSGEAGELDRDGLAAHVVAQAKKRAARDEKLFDY